MTYADPPDGQAVFLDANTLIFHFTGHPVFGQPSTHLLDRIENGLLSAYTCPSVLYEVSHRLMTIEAMSQFNWPAQGITARLRKHHPETAKLKLLEDAMAALAALRIRISPAAASTFAAAALICKRHGLLTGDGLIIAAMQHENVTSLASSDPDFDRVPGITRFTPT